MVLELLLARMVEKGPTLLVLVLLPSQHSPSSSPPCVGITVFTLFHAAVQHAHDKDVQISVETKPARDASGHNFAHIEPV
jgi:hypothetical protein